MKFNNNKVAEIIFVIISTPFYSLGILFLFLLFPAVLCAYLLGVDDENLWGISCAVNVIYWVMGGLGLAIIFV